MRAVLVGPNSHHSCLEALKTTYRLETVAHFLEPAAALAFVRAGAEAPAVMVADVSGLHDPGADRALVELLDAAAGRGIQQLDEGAVGAGIVQAGDVGDHHGRSLGAGAHERQGGRRFKKVGHRLQPVGRFQRLEAGVMTVGANQHGSHRIGCSSGEALSGSHVSAGPMGWNSSGAMRRRS